ncbi:DUF5050 domain-containing protein [Clostridium thermobutyricum]|uniref:Prolow-density lipoprotein receptor-related protein 1-like beta-propeller domain-containing protein n=1 Tax=Clostridium thermobutyricum DSM 4928 TaxID=1121339 RepID=A0A1V4STB0_9CLOT|nr:DUF5050 domain-containing protein [Clostridium thermobutyricum]OPX47130.1 hypothetical protein CLTHE_23790 [Clostridium thermobutyricum DSM 4928]
MRKLFILSLFALMSISLFGCNKDNSDEKNITSSLNSTDTIDYSKEKKEISDKKNNKNFSLTENSVTPSPFILNDSILYFPNWDNNNKISLINFSDKNFKITNKSVGEFFEYSTNSMTLLHNEIFFANGNDNYNFSKINLANKQVTKINNKSVRDICNDNVRIYYVDYKTNELFTYDPIDNISNKITSNKIGKFIVNGNNILYQNSDDKYKLYRVTIDGSLNEKLLDYSVESFAVYDDKLYFINSSDNNYLYYLDPETMDTRRVTIISARNISVYKNKLVFIDINDFNKLKSINIDLNKNKFNTSTIINDSINDFYISEKGIFYRKGIDVNSSWYLVTP